MTDTNPHRRAVPIVILIAAACVAGALFLLRPTPDRQVTVSPPLLVDAIEVTSETVQLKVNTHGTITASTETRLAAEVQGRIIEVSPQFVAGGFLRKGDVLLKIDDLQYRTAVARAQASVAAAKTRLAEEQGRAEVAYQDWLRRNSDRQRSASAHQLALRKPQIAAAEAELQAAKSDLAHARENLARTIVTAPYDGLLRERSADLGQHLSMGQEIGRLFATDKLEVRLPIAEHRIHSLQLPDITGMDDAAPPMLAQLSVEAQGQTYYWQARITRSEGILDERSRVLYLVATIDDPYQLSVATRNNDRPPLRLGTFVDAVVYGKTVDEVVRIPHHVLRTDNKVWVIGNDGTMQERSVDIIGTDNEFVYLSAGVTDGERIAMGHLDTTVTGTQVKIAKLVRGDGDGDTQVAEKSGHTAPPNQTSLPGAANSQAIGPVSHEENEDPQGI